MRVKVEDSRLITAEVRARNCEPFPFPQYSEMRKAKLVVAKPNGSLYEDTSVHFSHDCVLATNGKLYKVTLWAVENERVDNGSNGEMFSIVRQAALEILRKHACVMIWRGDKHSTFSGERVALRDCTDEALRLLFNKFTQGHDWTRDALGCLRGHIDLQAYCDQYKPLRLANKPVDHSSAMSFADYKAAGLTPPKPGTRISLS